MGVGGPPRKLLMASISASSIERRNNSAATATRIKNRAMELFCSMLLQAIMLFDLWRLTSRVGFGGLRGLRRPAGTSGTGNVKIEGNFSNSELRRSLKS